MDSKKGKKKKREREREREREMIRRSGLADQR